MILLGCRISSVVGTVSLTDGLGAVSSESKICSEIGIELLKMGVSGQSYSLET